MKAAIRTVSLFLPEPRSNALRVSTTLFLLSAAPKHSRVVMDQASENSCKQRWENDIPKGSQLYSDQIMPHILNLYGACAKAQDFEIYATHATFEDPLMCAHGVKQIKSAFYSLSKLAYHLYLTVGCLSCGKCPRHHLANAHIGHLFQVFSDSRIVEYTINEKVTSPGKNQILIDNKQHYKFLGRDIDMISLIVLFVEDGKVVRHEDRWNKKPLLNRETVRVPVVGRLIEVARRGSMLATHAFMGFGKDPSP